MLCRSKIQVCTCYMRRAWRNKWHRANVRCMRFNGPSSRRIRIEARDFVARNTAFVRDAWPANVASDDDRNMCHWLLQSLTAVFALPGQSGPSDRIEGAGSFAWARVSWNKHAMTVVICRDQETVA